MGSNGVAAPSGAGTWSVTGVSGATCSPSAPLAPTSSSAITSIYTCVVVAHTAGIYVPLFTYSGDANFSAAGPVSGYATTVNRADPTVAVDLDAATPTTVALGGTITFTALVSGPANAVAPSAANANVTWAITGVSGVTSCTSTSGPTAVSGHSNQATYSCTVVATRAATYGASFTFTGDSAYNAVATTPSLSTKTVVAAAPSAMTTTSSSTPTLGGSLTFTTTVTGSTNALAPSGAVSYAITFTPTIGTPSSTTCSNGSASTTGASSVGSVITTYTCTVATPGAGSYALTATFNGSGADTNYTLASSSLTVALPRATPTITLIPAASPAINQPMTLTATVTGVSGAIQPSAGVSFAITAPDHSAVTTCNTPVQPSPLPSSNVSTYTCTFTPTQTGTYVATATIGADTNYNLATSSPATSITIASATPGITLVDTAQPTQSVTVGTSITFTATVQGTTNIPTGTVSWSVSGAAVGNCSTPTTLTPTTGLNAIATCTIPTPNVGSYSLNATYNGDTTYSSITYPTALAVTVVAAVPTVTVAAPTPLFGGTITYTATVTGPANATAPAGVLTWTLTGPAGATTSCVTHTGPVAGLASQSLYTCTIPASPAGSYSAIATFNGNLADSNYTTVASTLTTVVILRAQPTVTLSSSGGTSPGVDITFTAVVTGTSGATAPSNTSGGVNWTIGGTGLITACSNGGAATGTPSGSATTYTCTITNPQTGTYTAIANYLGDTNYLTVTSSQVTVAVAANTATVAAITPLVSNLGGSVTLTTTVTGSAGTPTGAISWNITAPITHTPISCTTSSGPTGSGATVSYSCTIPTATAGNYTAIATFSGDFLYSSAVSPTATIVVAPVAPTLSVTGIQSTGSNGQVIIFTGHITGTTGSVAPTGAPTWTLTGPGGVTILASTCTIAGPSISTVTTSYTCTIPATTAGDYTTAITYAGDNNYTGPSTSAITTVTVTKLIPTVTVATSASTVSLGSTFTFTATVSGPTTGPTPSGTGTWLVAGVNGISCTSPTGPTGSANTVTYSCTVLASTAGTYIPEFTYPGDSNYFGVAQTSGSTTIATAVTPTVAVVANASIANLGDTISFTATVTGPSTAVAPTGTGSWVITGVAGVTACTSSGGPVPGSHTYVSTYTCSVVATLAGTYGATFTYPGDSGYNPVTSTVSSTTTRINPANPSILIDVSGSPTLGGSLTFTATVTGSAHAVAPAGAVNWSISGSGGDTACPAPTGATSSGVISTYTCVLQTPQAGDYIVTATFAGDPNYATATSNTLTSTLAKQLPAITVQRTSTPILGQYTNLSATVTGVLGAVQPTGGIAWSITGPDSGTVSCINSQRTNINSNVQTFTCSFLTALSGNYVVTATVGQDINYVAATSAPINVSLGTVAPQITFSAIPNPPATGVVGQTLFFTAVVAGSGSLAAPTGGVVWNISGGAIGCTSTSTQISGQTTTYTCSIFATTASTYTATAAYNGDSSYSSLPATTAISIVVNPVTPNITLTTPAVTPVLGGIITYTATIIGVANAAVPTGAVTWGVTRDGTTIACDSNTDLIAGSLSNQTIFTCTANAAQAGSYVATVTYLGDSNYTALASVTSSPVAIAKVPTTISLAGSGGGALNSTLTFTATVTGTVGSAAPSGNMTWTQTGTSLVAPCASTAPSGHVGVVTTYICTITASSYGTYVVIGHYLGDVNYIPGNSNSATINISTLQPTISISASTPTALGGTTTLTSFVSAPSGSSFFPTGTMSWTVADPTLSTTTCTPITATADVSAFATSTTAYQCTFPTPLAGTYTATANFLGDSNYNSVTSSALPVVVNKESVVSQSVTPQQSSTSNGPIITFTATIVGVTGSVPPSALLPNWTLTGPSSTCQSTTGPVVSGVTSIYTCVVPATSATTYTATVTYPGDNNYLAHAVSAPASLTIAALTPAIRVTTDHPTAALGSTFTFTATVSGPTTGLTPSGTGSWTITGVAGITCNSQLGPFVVNSYSVNYTCSVTASSAGTYIPQFTYGGDANYIGMPPTSGDTTFVGLQLLLSQ